ncbi:MAG: amino acid ABC transporter permease [Chloroflexota bacterium]|nr:amino acid ABC transporter permease [Chloroflexota bacterium]
MLKNEQPPAPDQVVAAMRGEQRRRSARFRLIFIATWIIIVGGILLALKAGPRFDPTFDLGPIDRSNPASTPVWVYILGGIPLTLVISVVSITIAIALALAGALGRLSKNAFVYGAASLYVSLVRGTPLIVQIIFVYYALPQVIPATADVPAIYLGIIALAFNYGAYMTEIFRAGIQAVPRGQREAAEALGMRESLVMRRVVMPQAIRIVIPAIGNDFISMTKDSALVSVIGVQELLWRAQHVGSANFRNLETLLLAAGVYWAITIVLSLFQERLERRMARGDR